MHVGLDQRGGEGEGLWWKRKLGTKGLDSPSQSVKGTHCGCLNGATWLSLPKNQIIR